MDAIKPTTSPLPALPQKGGAKAASAAARGDELERSAATTALATEPQPPENINPIKQVESKLNQVLEAAGLPNSRLKIELHEQTGHFVYKAINAESGEVVKQFPPEEILRQLSFFRQIQGLTVNRTA